MADMQVDFPTMQQAHADFVEAKAQCQKIGTQAQGTVAGLVGSSWTGEAASSYQRMMTSWDQNYQEVLRALQDLTDTMDASIKTYQANETRNQDLSRASGA